MGPALIMQFSGKGHARSVAYVAVNTLVWIIYAALVLLAPQMFFSHPNPVVLAASVLAAAVVLHPLRRWAARTAKQRFNHR